MQNCSVGSEFTYLIISLTITSARRDTSNNALLYKAFRAASQVGRCNSVKVFLLVLARARARAAPACLQVQPHMAASADTRLYGSCLLAS